MEKHVDTFDFILGAVAAQYHLNSYLNLLVRDANITPAGAPMRSSARFLIYAGQISFNAGSHTYYRGFGHKVKFCYSSRA